MKHVGRLLAILSMAVMTACTSTSITTPPPIPTSTATSTVTPTPTPTLTPTPTPVTYPMRLEQIGQFGGIADALALNGNKVYLKSGPRLVIVDVSNPYRPTITGRSEVLPDGIESIAAMDHYALVGDYEGNLSVFDVPKSGDPQAIGSIDVKGEVSGIVIDNHYAYIAARDADLQIVDVAEPAKPQIVGALELDGSAYKIARTGHIIVINSGFPDWNPDPFNFDSSIMHIVDASDPTQPDLLSTQESAKFVRHISASNHLVCFGNDVFDITDPAHPKALAIESQDNVWYDRTGDVIAGNYIFELSDQWEIYTGESSLFTVYDFTDHKAVALADTAIVPLPAGEIAIGDRVIVRDQLAFTVDYNGLNIYDLSVHPEQKLIVSMPPDIYAPHWKQVGELTTDVAEIFIGCCAASYPGEIDVVGDYLYTFTRDKVFVWSLQDPANPALVKALSRPRALSSGFWITKGHIRQGYWGDDFYMFFDTRDPANPTITKVMPGWDDGFIKAVNGDLLFYEVSGQDTNKLQLFDISDPYHPQPLGSYAPMPRTRTYYRIEGTYVYIRPYDGPTITLDIANPLRPEKVNISGPVLPQVSNYWVEDNTIFTFQGDQLAVYSLSDPANQLAELTVPYEIEKLQHIDGKLFLRGRSDELQAMMLTIVDVSDPVHPQLLGAVDVDAYNIANYQDYLYAATLRDGVFVFKLVPN